MEVAVSENAQNKVRSTKYSLILSLYCVSSGNQRVKFLYETNWSNQTFDQATEVYLQAMAEFASSDSGVVGELIQGASKKEHTYLVAWEDSRKELVLVNWQTTD